MGDVWPMSLVDQVVLGLNLSVPLLIGFFYGFIKRPTTNDSFLLADRKMATIPVSFSLAVSYLSSLTITGITGEISYHGVLYPITWLFASTIGVVSMANIFIPMFYQMNMTSIYEYLEIRYQSSLVRVLASICFSLSVLLYLGLVLSASCQAVQSLTQLPILLLIVIIGLIATSYAAMGGLKAVVWADLFQTFVILTSLICITTRGAVLAGGMNRVWEVAAITGRLQWINWDPSPFSTNTSLGIFGGHLVLWAAIFSCHQTQAQRYLSTRSPNQARISLISSVVILWVVSGCAILAGLVIFATYWSCDPKSRGLIQNKHNLITFFVTDHLLHVHGLPGLFVSSLLSAALSTLSSGLHSLATAVWEDLIRPFSWGGNLSEGRRLLITRSLVCLVGLITIGLSILASSQFQWIHHLGPVIIGLLIGPTLAIFILGLFTHSANKMGAVSGMICGNGFTIWLLIGCMTYLPAMPNSPALNTFTEGCINQSEVTGDEGNVTVSSKVRANVFMDVYSVVANITGNEKKPSFYIPDGDWQSVMYSLSLHLYPMSGFIIGLLVCLTVSFISGLCWKLREVEPLWLHPWVRSSMKSTCSGQSHHPTFQQQQFCDSDPCYNRWPSPSLPPTLKKNHSGITDPELRYQFGNLTLDANGIDDKDDDISYWRPTDSRHHHNSSCDTLDRTDIYSRNQTADMFSLTSIPDTNPAGNPRSDNENQKCPLKTIFKGSFSSPVSNSGHISKRKLERKSDTEEELDEDDDDPVTSRDTFTQLPIPFKNSFNHQTVIDEEGWTTDF